MKIGVNGRFLTLPYTGIGQYTVNLFRELAKIMPQDEFIMVVPEELEIDFPKNVRIEVLRERARGGSGMRKTWWEQIQLQEFFKHEKVDVAFFPYPSNPWPKDFYIKTIVTVHDCIPWTDKRYRKGVLSRMYHNMTRRAVKNADLVLTVSKTSKKEIHELCDVESKVVYNDVSDVYRKKASLDALKEFHLKEKEYFIYCGGFDVRKNVKKLISEYEKFAEHNENIPLVLAGGKVLDGKIYNSFDELESKFGHIVKTGFLSEEDLATLYQNCLGFVHLSEQEGFNIPLLEAAVGGAPLILSDIPVHREIAGADGAQFVEDDVASAMHNLLEDREKWSLRAQEIGDRFSWKKSAQRVKDMLS